MPNCCRCSNSGRCINCSCVKSNKPCLNCVPSRLNQCSNVSRGQITTDDLTLSNTVRSEENHPSDSRMDSTSEQDTLVTSSLVSSPHESGRPPFPPPLPEIHPSEREANSSKWNGTIDLNDFAIELEMAYQSIVHWKQNIFRVPSGKVGQMFVYELAKLFKAYGESNGIHSVAIKCAMVLPALLLQKPHPRSKDKENIAVLRRRLESWISGDIKSLLHEAQSIQNRLRPRLSHQDNESKLARTFSNLMFVGNVKAAMRLLSNQSRNNKFLSLQSKIGNGTTTVRDILLQKHPASGPLCSDALVEPSGSMPIPHPVIFQNIDGKAIKSAALRVRGSAGPSGADSGAWKRFCTSFRHASDDLCSAIATMARKLCTTYVAPEGLAAYNACRLIAIDKCPGVRPIGIGEVVRRIIGKAVLGVISPDIQSVTGTVQLCTGQSAGIESAIHAMCQIFQNPLSEGMLLIDARNAFNSLNRQVALRNISATCPTLATLAINTYREDIQLFIEGETILSSVGTTQGDPLSMAIYAVALMPLIEKVRSSLNEIHQLWYADDAAAAGRLEVLKDWLCGLCRHGPSYGYFINMEKTCLIVKNEYIQEADRLFRDFGINISSEAREYLGAAIGNDLFIPSLISKKVSVWIESVKTLSKIALSQPHAAYAGFIHGLSSQWSYALRTNPAMTNLLMPLEDVIKSTLIPAITGRVVSDTERELFALPPRLGGLGIKNPVQEADNEYEASRSLAGPLCEKIFQKDSLYDASVMDNQKKARDEVRMKRKNTQKCQFEKIIALLPEAMKRNVELATEKGASSWLLTLPIKAQGLVLHKSDFRDAIHLRYNWQPMHLRTQCICGKSFTVDHALVCNTGGLPTRRHNEVRDLTANLMTEICHNVSSEPRLQPLNGETFSLASTNRDDAARVDVSADGFWCRGQRAYFDVRIFNPNAPSYIHQKIGTVYRKHELEKRKTYEDRITQVEMGSFTPLVFSLSGGI